MHSIFQVTYQLFCLSYCAVDSSVLFIYVCLVLFSSGKFSCSVVSDSLRPHGLQHARLPYPSPSPGVCSNSCPLSRCCHPTISSSVIPFSFCLQSFPESGSFPMSQLFASDGHIIGASVSVIPMNRLTSLFFLQPKGFSRVFSSITV